MNNYDLVTSAIQNLVERTFDENSILEVQDVKKIKTSCWSIFFKVGLFLRIYAKFV